MALIVATTLVPLCALLWLGWKVLAQDRDLEAQQARTRLEGAAEVAIAAVQRAIAASEQQLAAGQVEWPADAVALTFHADRVDVSPSGRLAYLPVALPPREAADDTFAAAEALEYGRNDRAAAIAAYTALARSEDAAVRAGALLRLARNLSHSEPARALAVYAQLATIDDVAEGSVPVSLAAIYARCRLLAAAKRESELRVEATRLAADLARGRWPIDGAVYALYSSDAARWGASRPPDAERGEVLAEAATTLWQEWRTPSGGHASPARRSISVRGQPLAVLWQTAPGRGRALVAGRAFVESTWLRPLAALPDARGIAIAFSDVSGTMLFRLPADAVREPGARFEVRRTATQSELPWAVVVQARDIAGDAGFATRRRLLVAGFGLIVAMALVASYLIVRAVTRELAVARLHAEFVAAVSHEFRTPLTTLRQFTDMLRERPALDDERRRVCYEAQARATDRLTRLVESVLDFGRIEAGVRKYAFEARDCTELVRRVVDEFRVQPEAVGFTVAFSGNGALPVQVDDEALSRVLWNLLDNAVKYSPDDRRIDVAVRAADDSVAIDVRDHGIGIPAAERAVIFTKFRRGEQALARGIKGTGIGLAMASEIVRAHDGRIDVRSQPGEGSTFTIVLPVRG